MSLSRNRDVAGAEHVQNGEGHMYRDLLLTEDQIHGELTYVSSITLEPGCSIGAHTHSGDNEMYYIYEGTGPTPMAMKLILFKQVMSCFATMERLTGSRTKAMLPCVLLL